ncbi:MAG: (2Fe-2S) ferredoxin domain-containing protein [Sulfurovaceae bacterium]|jgi:(2Fe-2S) ferredoxin|nr:(2Fe-2S) ferredoxin domain-containing protein [Sulfurovaceae bacterium]MDD5548165.1 (2Fe-2S) ferredoxin domain-containing protein [Sulfurovaceae bacterium]
MDYSIPQPAFYIFKCQQSAPPGMPKPSCVSGANAESQQLFMHMAQSLMQKGIISTVQPIQAGCMNRCQLGPIMLVEPGHTMYVNLNKEKIDRIIEEHIIGGKVVEEYIIPSEMWGDAIDPKTLLQQ